jgi:hypothetical protein
MKRSLLFVSLLAGTALAAPIANATVLAVIGQDTSGDVVTATAVGGVTTIMSTAAVDITAIDAPLSTPIDATLVLDAHSVGPALTGGILGGNVLQTYTGSFSITGGGFNYLSGTFTDNVFGGGSSLTLSASSSVAGESVTFTSSVIPASQLASNFAVSFSLTDVSPNVHLVGLPGSRTIGNFNSDISGDFSASPIPEPSTWVMLALGFAGLCYAAVRRSARDRSAVAI